MTRVISVRGLEIINTLVCFGTQEPRGGEKSKKTKTSRQAAEEGTGGVYSYRLCNSGDPGVYTLLTRLGVQC